MDMTGKEEHGGKGDKGKGLGCRVPVLGVGFANLLIVTGSSLGTKSTAGRIGHTAQWP